MADLTSAEQLRLLEAALTRGRDPLHSPQLTPQRTGYRYGAYSPEGMVHTQGATVPGAPVRQNFAEWMWGYDPSKARGGVEDDPTVPAPMPAPAPPVEPIPIPPPQVMTAPGGGDNKTDTPSGVSAYKTKDGKVFFTNQQAPEGTTPLSYEKGYKEANLPGAPGRGGFVFAQEPPEVQQLKSLRDTLLQRQISEASLTPEQQLERMISQKKQLGAADTQIKLDELQQLNNLMGSVKMTPAHPVWKQISDATFKQLKSKNPQTPDEQLRAEAERLTQLISDDQYREGIFKMYGVSLAKGRPSDMILMGGE